QAPGISAGRVRTNGVEPGFRLPARPRSALPLARSHISSYSLHTLRKSLVQDGRCINGDRTLVRAKGETMTAALARVIPQRYWPWLACTALCAVCLALSPLAPGWYWPAAVFGFLALVGLLDFVQVKHSIRRNYPVVANLRFMIEFFRPEIRQYLLEGDNEEQPFSRAQRSVVYQRAKNVIDKRPFGTMIDLYEPHYEWINHSIAPADIASHDFRITV